MINLTARISAGTDDIALAVSGEPEEAAQLLLDLAVSLDRDTLEAMATEILCMHDQDRASLRAFSLMIAGACGEAE